MKDFIGNQQVKDSSAKSTVNTVYKQINGPGHDWTGAMILAFGPILFSNREERIQPVHAALAKSLNYGDIYKFLTKPGEFPGEAFQDLFNPSGRPRLVCPRRLDFQDSPMVRKK